MQDGRIIKDIVGWDTVNWSQALQYWDNYFPNGNLGCLNALELGSGFNGGLSLWLALKGIKVTCSGYHQKYKGASDKAKSIHKAYGVDNLIEYQEVDATQIPYESSYDIVCYKSMLGGIVRGGKLDIAQNVIKGIYDALKPGGVLFFAENITSTWLHKVMRKKYGSGKNKWRYFTIKEIEELHKQFDVFEYQTFGFLGCFGVNELQRTVLGKIDQMLFSNVLPKNMNYILAGVAIKGKNV